MLVLFCLLTILEVFPLDEQKYLYVLFSATPYRMGRMIRTVTGEPYNHVSIATGEDLSCIYSFARRYYCTPFYGGFVSEDPCRYRHKGRTADIRLYRLPLTSGQWRRLDAMLEDMKLHADRYLYNHLSAIAAPLHFKIRVRQAFTCAEFTVNVLSNLGFDFDPNRFYSIGDIAKRLGSYHIYTGLFPQSKVRDYSFFQPRPVYQAFYASARDLLRLFWRRHLQAWY